MVSPILITPALIEKRRQNQIRLWADPAYRANQLQKRNAAWKKQMSETMKVSEKHIKGRMKQRAALHCYYAILANRLAAKVRNSLVAQDPRKREKHRLKTLALLASPIYRQHAIDGHRKRNEKGVRWCRGRIFCAKAGCELPFQSSYEKRFIEFCNQTPDVLSLLRCPFFIQYQDKQVFRYYNPDFLAILANGRVIVIEIKASPFISWPINVAKFSAAHEFCEEKNLEFLLVTEKELAETTRIFCK